jgi:hypothetical protein
VGVLEVAVLKFTIIVVAAFGLAAIDTPCRAETGRARVSATKSIRHHLKKGWVATKNNYRVWKDFRKLLRRNVLLKKEFRQRRKARLASESWFYGFGLGQATLMGALAASFFATSIQGTPVDNPGLFTFAAHTPVGAAIGAIAASAAAATGVAGYRFHVDGKNVDRRDTLRAAIEDGAPLELTDALKRLLDQE